MNTIPAKTIITKKPDTSWFGTDYNMNIYKGCCHGCIYCDSRSDCYQIPEFDTVRAKENALSIIQEELRKKTKSGVIGTGSMSDPYNPYEKQYGLTRKALELIDTYHFGVGIATKSDLISRDIDILRRIQEHSPVICKITITAYDDALSRKIEPLVSTSSKRFEAVCRLSEAGIFTGILMMPLLPYLTDNEDNVRSILHAAIQCGAKFIYPLFGLSLRSGQREYLYGKFDELFPELRLKQAYSGLYGSSYECHSPNEKELHTLFVQECQKAGILYRMEDIIAAYKNGYDYEQLSLFS
ncbi:MAG TPA: radical SAM protein [Mobilitalea sp.]|nr:radical SAM protein [Mobilitalea sp.]